MRIVYILLAQKKEGAGSNRCSTAAVLSAASMMTSGYHNPIAASMKHAFGSLREALGRGADEPIHITLTNPRFSPDDDGQIPVFTVGKSTKHARDYCKLSAFASSELPPVEYSVETYDSDDDIGVLDGNVQVWRAKQSCSEYLAEHADKLDWEKIERACKSCHARMYLCQTAYIIESGGSIKPAHCEGCVTVRERPHWFAIDGVLLRRPKK